MSDDRSPAVRAIDEQLEAVQRQIEQWLHYRDCLETAKRKVMNAEYEAERRTSDD